MITPQSDAWARARDIARNPGATSWRQDLAEALEQAVRPDAVGVFMCVLGNVLDASVNIAPKDHQGLGELLVEEYFPRALRAGALTPWAVFADSEDVNEGNIAEVVQRELLRPAGFAGTLVKFLRIPSGMVVGWLTVFCRQPVAQRAAEIETSLHEVCQIAAETVARSLSIATSAGARLPQLSPVLLSEREREVARLVISGLSDVNIAQRLDISEGTVGRHLQNIFRKLEVNSRMELFDLLGGRE